MALVFYVISFVCAFLCLLAIYHMGWYDGRSKWEFEQHKRDAVSSFTTFALISMLALCIGHNI